MRTPDSWERDKCSETRRMHTWIYNRTAHGWNPHWYVASNWQIWRHRFLTLAPPPAALKQHLFKHKRCACRPCNLAISCSCSAPTLQSRVCDPLTAGTLDIGEWDAEIVWRASHCDRPRSSYSSKGYASHAPVCAGGEKDGFPCTSSVDCGSGGYCDGHCPSLLFDRWRLRISPRLYS